MRYCLCEKTSYICLINNNKMKPNIKLRDHAKNLSWLDMDLRYNLFRMVRISMGYGYQKLSIHGKINIRQAYAS